jgi:hypothetical protein
MQLGDVKRTFAVAIVMILAFSGVIGLTAALNPLQGDDWEYDPDGDRLTNLDEFIAGSDPNNYDTDGDGLPDGWEVENSLDPTDPADALLDNDYFGGEEYASYTQVDPPYDNYAEYFRLAGVDADTGENVYIPTDPNNPDTDGDSVLDPDDSWPWDFSNDGTSGGGNGGQDSGEEGEGQTEPGDGDGDGDGNVDDDGDGITDTDEMAMGTDFNNPDTDGDGLSDSGELARGLDPNDWDTDNDMLIDGVEAGGSDSTDGHLVDSDGDGLPDPWEDNDGDGILNIEEQDICLWFWAWITPPQGGGGGTDPYQTYLIAYRFRLNPNSNDTDGDDISDDKETQAYAPGPINMNSRSEYNYHQVNNETGQGRWIPDRWNNDHDLSNPASGFSKWTEGRYSWWQYWFTKSYELGSLPLQTYKVVLYNLNPWLLWYWMWDTYGVWPAEVFVENFYHDPTPIGTYSTYTTWEDVFGWQDRGKATTDPKLLRWNMYDTDPSQDDTDGDRMEDNWDPRPTIPDDRLDTGIALSKIGYPQPGGGLEWYYPSFGPGRQAPISALFVDTPGSNDAWSLAYHNFQSMIDYGVFMHDYYGFPYRIIDSTMNKGMPLYMEIIVGIEMGHPGAEFFTRGFYNYLNVSITFHNGSTDVDPDVYGEGPTRNVSYDLDDDVDGDGVPRVLDVNPMTGMWIYNPEESQYPMFALGLDDLNPENIPDEMIFDEFNPNDFLIDGYGYWRGPDDPYYVEATGERHDGLQVPFINISNYPDPAALHPSGTNMWFYWSTMTFYKIGFHFMVPEGVMAGFVVMDMIIDTEQNIHVEESFDAFGEYPYIAY